MPNRDQTIKIGITGGIGAGKSIVTRLFTLLGIPAYNADERAKYLMNHHEELKQEILDRFGEQAYVKEKLNRQFMADHVFNDDQKLQSINNLVHPKVNEDFQDWLKDHDTSPYILKEAALLYESGSYKQLDKVILVSAPRQLRIERVLLRDPHRSVEDIEKIIKNQMPERQKESLADYHIINDDKEMVIPQVLEIHKKITKL